jgi:hypothetical protein
MRDMVPIKKQSPLLYFLIMDSPKTHNPALKIKIPEIETIRNKFLPFFNCYDLGWFSKYNDLVGNAKSLPCFLTISIILKLISC